MSIRMTVVAGWVLALAGSIPAGIAADAGSVSPPEPLILFLQQELRPHNNPGDIDRGMVELLSRLPPGREVAIYAFQQERYRLLLAGPAGRLHWPPPGFELTVAGAATGCPFRALLAFLQDQKLEDQTVCFISDGYSGDPYARLTVGPVTVGTPRTPDGYPPVLALIDHCRLRHIRVIGVYADRPPTHPTAADAGQRLAGVPASNPENLPASVYLGNSTGRREHLRPASFDRFRYAVEESGGKAFYGFGSYRGLFRKLVKDGLLR